MFCFSLSYSLEKLKKEKQSRIRVIGETDDGRLLISVNTPSFTNIEVVSSDGESMTAISFPHYIDFVNASLSPDNELLHVVERNPSPKGFSFSSKIINIFGKQTSKEVASDEPITGIFLPMKKEIVLQMKQSIEKSSKSIRQVEFNQKSYNVIKTYQMLHFIGSKLTHITVTLTENSVEIQKIRGGVNLPYIIAYHYFRETSSLAVVYLDDKLSKLTYFQFTEDSIRSKPPNSIEVLPKSQLPIELALSPSSQRHFPIFRNQSRRFFFARAQGQDFIVQQLYSENDSSLSFNISSYPKPFSQNISIPGVTPDHPICYFNLPSLMILFIPNMFCVIIDISNSPPLIMQMPVFFSLGLSGPLSSNLPIDNTIIDIDTCDIYKLSVDFSQLALYSKAFNNFTVPAVSTICSRLNQPKAIADFLKCLDKSNDSDSLYSFIMGLMNDFHTFSNPHFTGSNTVQNVIHPANSFSSMRKVNSFSPLTVGSLKGSISTLDKLPQQVPITIKPNALHIKKHRPPHLIQDLIQSYENEFPSAGRVPRSSSFRKIYLDIISDKEISHHEAAEKALDVIKAQNDYSLVIRKALDLFKDDSTPLFSFLSGLLFETETEFESLPEIKCLKSELTNESNEVCPHQIVAKLASSNVIHPVFSSKEAHHWRERIPSYLFEKSISNTSSSDSTASSFSSTISNSQSQVIIPRSSDRRSSLTVPHRMIIQPPSLQVPQVIN